MALRKHVNLIRTTLATTVNSSATSVTFTSSTGFPSIGVGEVFRVTVRQGTKVEVWEVTDDASAPTYTVTRAMENTTAQAFTAGAVIEVCTTADSHDRKADGAASSTDNALPRFDGSSGKILQASSVIVDDSNNVSGVAGLTATGVVDLGGATSLEIPNDAAPTVNATGEIALDTSITDHKPLMKYYSGAEEMVVIAVPTADLTTSDNYILEYDATGDKFQFVAPSTGGGGGLDAYTTTTTANGTTTLTVSSDYQQYFTGSSPQNCRMPVTSTLVLGQSWLIVNLSSNVVTVQSSGANTIIAMAANTVAVVTCILTSGTSAASWNYQYCLLAGVYTGTANQIDVTGNVISLVSGGTLPGAGGWIMPSGSTGSRGANATAKIRFNTSTGYFEYNDSSSWINFFDLAKNLPVTNLNSGTSASSSTFWRGDGTWATPIGAVVQEVYASYATYTTINAATTGLIPWDDTIPQNTEGDEILTLAITPTNSSNILVIEACPHLTVGTSGNVAVVAIFQDSTANAIAAADFAAVGGSFLGACYTTHRMTAGTTSATTFKIRVGVTANLMYTNGNSVGRKLGGLNKTWFRIREYKV